MFFYKCSNIAPHLVMKKLCNQLTTPYLIATRSLIKGGTPAPDNTCKDVVCKPVYGPPPVHRGEFLSGISVGAAHPLGGTIGACTVMFQAGSRNEFDDSLGVTHFIRAASNTSGLAHSGFIRTRYLQQEGGYLTCRTDRQTIAFTLRCPEPVFFDLKGFLTDLVTRCEYPDHELSEVRKQVREDLQQRPKEQHVMDLVQKACFSGPLSNSVYCEEERINTINSKVITDFIDCNFKTCVCSVGSSNVCYGEVMKVGTNIERNRSGICCTPLSCPRGGYEFYDTGPGETYMAFAVPGTGTCDFCCLLKHAILAAACGLGNVHGGSHSWDRTPMEPLASLSSANDIFTDYKAFNISYCDTGCFDDDVPYVKEFVAGILVKTRSPMARCTAFRAAEFLGNINDITTAQIEVGKRRLKVGVAFNDDTCVRLSESIALQAANKVAYNNAAELGCLIDRISPEEVKQVANCIAAKRCQGQMAVAVVGDVEAAPHDGELRC